MPLMAKRRTSKPAQPATPPADPPKTQRSGRALGLYISDQLADALDAYIASTRPRVSKTSALEVALEEFLRARGFLPGPTPPAAEE
jgi:hypothetical protein